MGGDRRVRRLVLYSCVLHGDGPVRPETCRSLHIKTLLYI